MNIRAIIQYVILGVIIMCYTTNHIHAANATAIRIAQLHIKQDQLEPFLVAVKEGMEAALRTEEGVLAIYAVADKNDPTKMTFFEMYVDDNAYQAHRQTPHFQKYFNTTKDMIDKRVLLEAIPVELRDKHNTPKKQ